MQFLNPGSFFPGVSRTGLADKNSLRTNGNLPHVSHVTSDLDTQGVMLERLAPFSTELSGLAQDWGNGREGWLMGAGAFHHRDGPVARAPPASIELLLLRSQA